jgi:superfamily II DNA or RNA helicase
MSRPDLRAYQSEIIDRVVSEIAVGHRRLLLVAPTGAGKTVIAAAIIAEAAKTGRKVLVMAHRREIIEQTHGKLYAFGIDAGIIQCGFAPRPGQPVQVASIQTLHARARRSSAIDLPQADLVVVDEAHHARANSYTRLLDAYPDAIIIGMTATPCRSDGRGLGNVFDVLIECPSVAELITAEFLVQSRIFAPTEPDLSGVPVARGDYVEARLAERMDNAPLIGDIVSHWHRLAERRRTVVFATGVQHSVHLRDEFRRSGVLAEHIDGSTPIEERASILAGLAAGTVEVVCNAMVLTEGWDQPEVSCLVLARPTKSLGLYRQMVGRILRPASGKADALILDHAGAVFAHGFPDDPIEWTLAEDRRAENKAHAGRGTHNAPSLTNCPECSAVRFEGKPCPLCNWRPRPKPLTVEVVEGDLGPVDRRRLVKPLSADIAERRRFHAQLAWIARERGHQPGWASYKFKERFGVWPPDRYIDPQPPDEATRAWVRSRPIAYAKARRSA